MKITIREQILTSLSLSTDGYFPREKLIDVACSHPGCEDREAVELELSELAKQGLVAINEGLVYAVPSEQDLANFYAAADSCRKEMAKRNSWRYRVAVFFTNIWSKFWHIIFLVSSVGLTLALCLAATPKAHGVEVPDSIIRALVMVESGATWENTGDISGDWARGKAGEISHFQLSRAAIADMGATAKARRIAADPVLAESFARLWLSRCYDRAGNWPEAVARYNAGSRYRSRAARDYSARILALAAP